MISVNVKVQKVLVGSDFSQQEPRLLAFYSKDQDMLQAYANNKDLYAMVAAKVYKNAYEDNLEFYPDGSQNVAGAERRSSCKSIILGIMYSRGPRAIAKQIHSSVDEAKGIIDDFYREFPNVKVWMDASAESLKRLGYVEDFYGRRRHLPNIMLKPYMVTYTEAAKESNVNPFLICEDKPMDGRQLARFEAECAELRGEKALTKLRQTARKLGIDIAANTNKISKAQRQCVNARIQGGAATMTKIAMNKIFRDPELNSYGFKLLIGVHDELIGEVSAEFADKAAERLSYVMRTCVNDIIDVPFKCDADVSRHWYYHAYSAVIRKEFGILLNDGKSEEEAFAEIAAAHVESTEAVLRSILAEDQA